MNGSGASFSLAAIIDALECCLLCDRRTVAMGVFEPKTRRDACRGDAARSWRNVAAIKTQRGLWPLSKPRDRVGLHLHAGRISYSRGGEASAVSDFTTSAEEGLRLLRQTKLGGLRRSAP